MSAETTVRNALVAFLETAKAAWKEEVKSYIGRDKIIVDMARLAARNSQFQPAEDFENEMVMGCPGGEICRDVGGTAAFVFPIQPRWMCFWGEASRAFYLYEEYLKK